MKHRVRTRVIKVRQPRGRRCDDACGGDKDLFCAEPWETLQIATAWNNHSKLLFRTCGPCWSGDAACVARVPLSKAADLDIMAVLNTPRIQAVRRDMLDGFHAMCTRCPRRRNRQAPVQRRSELPPHHRRILRYQTVKASDIRNIRVAYDASCNLACSMCRPRAVCYGNTTAHYEQLIRMQDAIIKPLMRTARRIDIASNGDPFGSPAYWDLLTTVGPDAAPGIELALLTNGQGFTAENYGKILLKNQITQVNISVDAASPATYKQIRGGDWSRLCCNLAFAAALRAEGSIREFELGFVYQQRNWREFPAFLRLAEGLGADRIFVWMLLPHRGKGRLYNQWAVQIPSHAEHVDAMSVLRVTSAMTSVPVYVEWQVAQRSVKPALYQAMSLQTSPCIGED